MQKSNHKKKVLEGYARYTSIAFQMIAIILLGVFGGIKLDEWLTWKFPVFTVVFSIVAVMLSIYSVVSDLLKKKK
jgi:F0F1-type ATP synthase assembly protein I